MSKDGLVYTNKTMKNKEYRDYIIELNNKETIREHKYDLPRFGIAATKTILEHKQNEQHKIKYEVKRRMTTLQFMGRIPEPPSDPIDHVPTLPSDTTNTHF